MSNVSHNRLPQFLLRTLVTDNHLQTQIQLSRNVALHLSSLHMAYLKLLY